MSWYMGIRFVQRSLIKNSGQRSWSWLNQVSRWMGLVMEDGRGFLVCRHLSVDAMVFLNDLGLQALFTPQRIHEIPRTLGTWLFPVPGSANDRKPTTTSRKKEEEEEEEEKSTTYVLSFMEIPRNQLYIKDVNREKNGNAWWIFVALKPTHKLY